MQITVSNLNDILIREDIEGLIAAGAPADEYADEAAQIAAALSLLSQDQLDAEHILAAVSLVWAKSFDLSGENMKLRLPAIERVARQILNNSGSE